MQLDIIWVTIKLPTPLPCALLQYSKPNVRSDHMVFGMEIFLCGNRQRKGEKFIITLPCFLGRKANAVKSVGKSTAVISFAVENISPSVAKKMKKESLFFCKVYKALF